MADSSTSDEEGALSSRVGQSYLEVEQSISEGGTAVQQAFHLLFNKLLHVDGIVQQMNTLQSSVVSKAEVSALIEEQVARQVEQLSDKFVSKQEGGPEAWFGGDDDLLGGEEGDDLDGEETDGSGAPSGPKARFQRHVNAIIQKSLAKRPDVDLTPERNRLTALETRMTSVEDRLASVVGEVTMRIENLEQTVGQMQAVYGRSMLDLSSEVTGRMKRVLAINNLAAHMSVESLRDLAFKEEKLNTHAARIFGAEAMALEAHELLVNVEGGLALLQLLMVPPPKESDEARKKQRRRNAKSKGKTRVDPEDTQQGGNESLASDQETTVNTGPVCLPGSSLRVTGVQRMLPHMAGLVAPLKRVVTLLEGASVSEGRRGEATRQKIHIPSIQEVLDAHHGLSSSVNNAVTASAHLLQFCPYTAAVHEAEQYVRAVLPHMDDVPEHISNIVSSGQALAGPGALVSMTNSEEDAMRAGEMFHNATLTFGVLATQPADTGADPADAGTGGFSLGAVQATDAVADGRGRPHRRRSMSAFVASLHQDTHTKVTRGQSPSAAAAAAAAAKAPNRPGGQSTPRGSPVGKQQEQTLKLREESPERASSPTPSKLLRQFSTQLAPTTLENLEDHIGRVIGENLLSALLGFMGCFSGVLSTLTMNAIHEMQYEALSGTKASLKKMGADISSVASRTETMTEAVTSVRTKAMDKMEDVREEMKTGMGQLEETTAELGNVLTLQLADLTTQVNLLASEAELTEVSDRVFNLEAAVGKMEGEAVVHEEFDDVARKLRMKPSRDEVQRMVKQSHSGEQAGPGLEGNLTTKSLGTKCLVCNGELPATEAPRMSAESSYLLMLERKTPRGDPHAFPRLPRRAGVAKNPFSSANKLAMTTTYTVEDVDATGVSGGGFGEWAFTTVGEAAQLRIPEPRRRYGSPDSNGSGGPGPLPETIPEPRDGDDAGPGALTPRQQQQQQQLHVQYQPPPLSARDGDMQHHTQQQEQQLREEEEAAARMEQSARTEAGPHDDDEGRGEDRHEFDDQIEISDPGPPQPGRGRPASAAPAPASASPIRTGGQQHTQSHMHTSSSAGTLHMTNVTLHATKPSADKSVRRRQADPTRQGRPRPSSAPSSAVRRSNQKALPPAAAASSSRRAQAARAHNTASLTPASGAPTMRPPSHGPNAASALAALRRERDSIPSLRPGRR